MMERIVNSSSTNSSSWIFLGMGLSMFPTSTSAEPTHKEFSSEDLFAIEREYNTPMEFSTDEYVKNTYKVEFFERPIYKNLDFAFVDLTQKFSERQINLDNDFVEALDELFASEKNEKPTKRRF